LEEGLSWIGFDGVVGFDPGKGSGPCSVFSLGFILVVDERAGLQIGLFNEVKNFLLM
jgi:hypothetical protein